MQRPRRALPTSREDMRERRESRVSSRPDATNSFNSNMTSTQSFHQQPFQSSARYPDAGLIDRGGLRDRFLQSRAVPGSGIGPPVPRSQPEPTRFTQEDTNRSVTRSSRKRTRVDAGLSADAKDNLGDATPKSQRSTRRSKRTKTSSKENNTDDEGERKLRKTSKLNVKIAQGKGPKRGSLGPNGEIRIRGDQMEFRDVNNPKWSKHIHC